VRVLIVDDERNIGESISRLLELEGIQSEVAADGREGMNLLAEQAFDAAILDLKMPVMDGQQLLEWISSEGLRMPVIMISALGDITDAVKALKSGANDYLIKPFDPSELLLKLRALVASRKQQDLLEAGARTAPTGARLIGESAGARALRLLIQKVAPGDSTVLITGESGTGKEVVAREIHACSGRSEEPFVAVNIGAIHEHLMESELFGHEKGAFTGAVGRTMGLFELAGNGSLFLDEIGEMPLALQVKLLRVIQERRIRRLGGTHDIPVAARILSATNRDIESMVREGRFREDLYYRLNVVRISVPPLRERRADIPLLAGYLMKKLGDRMPRPSAGLSPQALASLSSYAFPGNIRELENVLERAMIAAGGDTIMPADLQLPRDRSFPARGKAMEPGASGSPALPGDVRPINELEREAIVNALDKWNGNRTKAAQELGISRRTILNKIKRFGLG
jgi:two-component system, NtrC family, response regulator AtoC